MLWLRRFPYLKEVKKLSSKESQNSRLNKLLILFPQFLESCIYIRLTALPVSFSTVFFFQVENDVIGQELQKQLEAAGNNFFWTTLLLKWSRSMFNVYAFLLQHPRISCYLPLQGDSLQWFQFSIFRFPPICFAKCFVH